MLKYYYYICYVFSKGKGRGQADEEGPASRRMSKVLDPVEGHPVDSIGSRAVAPVHVESDMNASVSSRVKREAKGEGGVGGEDGVKEGGEQGGKDGKEELTDYEEGEGDKEGSSDVSCAHEHDFLNFVSQSIFLLFILKRFSNLKQSYFHISFIITYFLIIEQIDI